MTKNRTIINSNEIKLNIKKNEYKSFGKTKINFENSYNIFSEDIIYNVNKKIFFWKLTTFTDGLNNKITTTKFNYNQNFVIDGENINLIDNEQNKYFVSIGKIKLNEQNW